MNRLILAGVAALGCLSVAYAKDAGTPALGNRSADWKKNVAMAVNDETKITSVVQSMPEADRAAFAVDVLAVLQSKPMDNKAAWSKELSEAAAALVAGAGGAKTAMLSEIAKEIVTICVTAESRELSSGDLTELAVLTKKIAKQLKSEDRVAFANAMLQAVDKQKAADAATHKQALSTVALALFAGAGEDKKVVVAEDFAVVAVSDLGTVASSLSNALNQRKNSKDDYQQMALQYLQAVATRLAGQPEAATRFAYAVAMFVFAADNPKVFEQELMGKIADLETKVGTTNDGFATALTAAKADMTASGELAQGVVQNLGRRTIWGVVILTPADILLNEEGIPFVHENRPPGGYQNQGI